MQTCVLNCNCAELGNYFKRHMPKSFTVHFTYVIKIYI